MAKDRPQPNSNGHKAPAASRPHPGKPAPARRRVARPTGLPLQRSSGTPRRSTYVEAVAVYERGLEALQRHDYQTAVMLFGSVLMQYPEEKELHERVRLYLNICQRHVAPHEATPQTIEERLYASTLALNGGKYDEALAHLRLVRDEDPDNDHALYMLAVAHTQRGEHTEAIAHLERAVALNPETRALARRDPDLEPLRQDESFRAALEAASAPPQGLDHRRPTRTKSAR